MTDLAPAARALLRLLGRTGALSATEVARLGQWAETSELPLHELAEREGLITGEMLATLLGDTLRLPVVDPTSVPPDAGALRALSEAVAIRHEVVPLRLDGAAIEVATANPLDAEALKAVEFATGRRVRPVVATRAQILGALARAYAATDEPEAAGPDAVAELRALVEALRAEQQAATTESRAAVAEATTMAGEALRRLAAAAMPAADGVAAAVATLRADVARLGADVVRLSSVVDDARPPAGGADVRGEMDALRAAIQAVETDHARAESAIARRLDQAEQRTRSSMGSHVKSLSDAVEQLRRQIDAQDVGLGRARLEAAGAGRRAAEALHRVEAVAADELPAVRERLDALDAALGAALGRLEERLRQVDARVEQQVASGRAAAGRIATELRELHGRIEAVAARLPEPEEETPLRRVVDAVAALAAAVPSRLAARLGLAG